MASFWTAGPPTTVWPGSPSASWTSPTGARSSTTGWASLSTAGTTTPTRPTWLRFGSPTPGWSALRGTFRTGSDPTDSYPSRTWVSLRFGWTWTPTGSSATSSAPSTSTPPRRWSTRLRPCAAPSAINARPQPSRRSAAGSPARRSPGSGAQAGASSSPTCHGCSRRGRPAPATARSRPRFFLTSAPGAGSPPRGTRLSHAPRRWASPTPPTLAGACGRSLRPVAATPSLRTFAGAGR